MTDVFISYAHEDEPRVRPLVKALEKLIGRFSGIDESQSGRPGIATSVRPLRRRVACWWSGRSTQ